QFQQGAKVAAEWWRLFNSRELEAIIKEAIANNPTLQAAQASLRQSQYNLRAGYGVFYPAVGGGFGASRQRYSPLKIGQSAPPSIFSLFTLSATISYALDVFGGERRAVEALGAEVDLQRASERATYLTLTSNIVNTVIAKAAYRAEIEATRKLIELQKEQVKLAEAQAQAGTAPYSSVLSFQSLLASNEAEIPQLQQKLSQTEHLLATLVGHMPAEWKPPELVFADLTLPGELPVSLPSDLVRQRPDILAAEAVLHNANANVGVATAALFPSFSLNAGYGTNNTALDSLFAASGNFWTLGANVTTPIFQGGTLWYERKAAMENLQQSLASYRGTALGAFAQVADTLRALEHDATTLEAQGRARETADQALRLITANYEAGLATYTDVLVANVQYYQTTIAELESLAVRYQDTVALFVALGGGWWNAEANSSAGPR
ncbi:MAG: efflux transporter outer membrane subunit, partial [Alphaproteobacteria bacterium]